MRGFKIVKQPDVINELLDYRVNYNERGKYLGFNSLNDHYSMQLGNVTDWTGFPMSGKTQVLMECLLTTSKNYGWRHLVYFPDVGNKTEIVSDLLHKLTGKSFNPNHQNHIDEQEIHTQLDWILHHFLILTKEDVKAKMTPFEFWDYAVKVKQEQGLQTASIDSWKDLTHDYAKYGGYAQYLEVVLPYRNQIAEDNDLHLHTIIHPKLTEKENGKRKPPTPYDLKGGSEWFNSGKCMITIHRESNETNEVQMIFGKIKPRAIGKVGQINLFFDVPKFVYYEMSDNMGQPVKRYSQKEGADDTEAHIEPSLTPIGSLISDTDNPF